MPLDLSLLYDACVSLGVRLGGAAPSINSQRLPVTPILNRRKSIRKGVYWLKGVPLPSRNSGDTPTDGGYVNGQRIAND